MLSVLCAGCPVLVDGDFDGVPFRPDGMVLAAADRHAFVGRDGAAIAVARDPERQRLALVLSSAHIIVDEDWRRWPLDRLLEARRALATSDGLLLTDIPLEEFFEKDELVASREQGVVRGDFDFAVASAMTPELAAAEQGIGERITIRIQPLDLQIARRGDGAARLDLAIERERDVGQDGEVATGTVRLQVAAALQVERLGESNLGVAGPILRCVQAVGPSRGASCKEASPEPYVDETGFVR